MTQDKLSEERLANIRMISGRSVKAWGGGEMRLTVTRTEAAELCHLSPSGFDVWVRKGIVPGPVAGTRRWSRAAIEHALNRTADNDDPEDAYRRWKESRAG